MFTAKRRRHHTDPPAATTGRVTYVRTAHRQDQLPHVDISHAKINNSHIPSNFSSILHLPPSLRASMPFAHHRLAPPFAPPHLPSSTASSQTPPLHTSLPPSHHPTLRSFFPTVYHHLAPPYAPRPLPSTITLSHTPLFLSSCSPSSRPFYPTPSILRRSPPLPHRRFPSPPPAIWHPFSPPSITPSITIPNTPLPHFRSLSASARTYPLIPPVDLRHSFIPLSASFRTPTFILPSLFPHPSEYPPSFLHPSFRILPNIPPHLSSKPPSSHLQSSYIPSKPHLYLLTAPASHP